MVAVNVPDSPAIGDTFTAGDITRKWDGEAWKIIATTITGPAGASADWSTAQFVSDKTDSYTLLSTDVGRLITFNKSTAVTCTVNGTLDLAIGQRIDILQLGVGQVTVVASSATVNGTPGLKLRAQYSAATVLCIAADTYVLLGDLAA